MRQIFKRSSSSLNDILFVFSTQLNIFEYSFFSGVINLQCFIKSVGISVTSLSAIIAKAGRFFHSVSNIVFFYNSVVLGCSCVVT